MTDQPFAYNNLTLDELRSMAASPQVGPLQSMPPSFQALADRVAEVADLLTHTQTNLPHWWKGPAANQAAATLARAAAEARNFHESALAAATAVNRCAQVVAEQQHQIMTIPNLPDPPITATIQRPTTPFEALEAARQDAAYQAAHEQAVQVVNGIAAQYVETRRELSNIGVFFGENFMPLISAPRQAPHPASSEHRTPPTGNPRNIAGMSTVGQHISESVDQAPGSNSHSTSTSRQSPPEVLHFGAEPGPGSDTLPKQEAHEVPGRSQGGDPASVPGQLRKPAGSDHGFTPEMATAANDFACNNGLYTYEHPTVSEKSGLAAAREVPQGHSAASRQARLPPASTIGQFGDASFDADKANNANGAVRSPKKALTTLSSLPPAELGLQATGNDNQDTAMIPPYNSLGSIHSLREGRNPRPTYLKERKSAWLPDSVAVPADGVIRPD